MKEKLIFIPKIQIFISTIKCPKITHNELVHVDFCVELLDVSKRRMRLNAYRDAPSSLYTRKLFLGCLGWGKGKCHLIIMGKVPLFGPSGRTFSQCT
jgi:hypothetical protein